jgi:hypothetical protein
MAPGAHYKRILVYLAIAWVCQAVAPLHSSFAGTPQGNPAAREITTQPLGRAPSICCLPSRRKG